MTHPRFMLTTACLLACWLSWASASAFPGVLVDENASERTVHTTHVVVLQGEGVSVVTTMIDYEGPRTRFALLLPVPRDVELRKVHTLRREILSRVEEISAPRMHEFFEQDPCAPGPVQQAWEETVLPKTRGFLTSPMLPPPDASYRVSNEMSIPSQPVFKGEESEFSHTLLAITSQKALETALARRGYRISRPAVERLLPHLVSGEKLLLSEVKLDRVELIGGDSIQLGGIRYTTREPLTRVKSTLGLAHSPGTQELFVYVLDPTDRYEAANYPNVMAPTNVALLPGARLDLGRAYNALFDRVTSQKAAIVTEYVWPTDGCGEPCPNAPLELRELLSLGGDELEALRARRTPERAIPASKQPSADERELTERRALITRQRYVLSRLHYRYGEGELPRDLELTRAKDAVSGGLGVPKGPSAMLDTNAKASEKSSFQTRFFAAHPWSGTTPCANAVRFRWGKRWKSMGRVSRRVPVAIDLPRLARDPAELESALARPIANLKPTTPEPPRAEHPSPPPERSSGNASCRIPTGPLRASGTPIGLLMLVGFLARACAARSTHGR